MSFDALGLSLLVRTSALLLLTAALATLLRRQSAALRHLVWTTGLAGTLALPLMSLTLPALPLLPAALPSASTVAGTATRAATESPLPAPAGQPRAAQASSEAVTQARSVGSNALLPSRPAVAQSVDSPDSAGTALWLAYGIGVLLLLGWIALGELAIRRFGGRSAPLDTGEWRELVDELRAAGSVPSRVRFRVSDDASVPLTYGILRPVVILPASGRQWPLSHRRDVLAHELAHVRRRDCLTHLLGRIACALHWYHPLAWLALSRIRLEREHACDDAVLSGGSLASGYADALLVTARTMRGRPALAGAGLAFARGSSLSERLRAVLDDGRRRGSPRPPALLALAALGLVATSAVATVAPRDASAADPPSASTAADRSAEAPSPNQRIERDSGARVSARTTAAFPTTEPPGGGPRSSTVVERDDEWPIATEQARRAICPRGSEGRERTVRLTGSMSITGQGSASDGKDRYVAWTGADCSVVIQSRGKVTFNESETDVATLDDGALFRITHEIGRTERSYRVSGRGSRLEREYRVDGRAAEMDRAFEDWRGTLVLEFIRRSGYDAEGRVRRILDRDGVGGVLAEVRQIESDHVASRYLGHLIAIGRLDPRSATDVLEEAGSGIESDFELGRVLVAVPTRLLEDEGVSRAFVAAARTIESDYELRKALDALLASGPPSPEVTGRLLELATTIESDFELAELLVGLAARGAVTGDFDAAYFAAVATIESDFEAHRVLSALLKSGPRSPATLEAGLRAARSIDSDFELASWLVEVAAAAPLTERLRAPFFAAAASVESAHERGRLLRAALATEQPSTGLLEDILDAATDIDSDFEKAGLLADLANRGLVTETLRPAFRRAFETLGSRFERDRVLAALGRRAI
ncbi:MAG: M56 family metallopeptidase [Gemmatimonadales bacterium]